MTKPRYRYRWNAGYWALQDGYNGCAGDWPWYLFPANAACLDAGRA